MEGPQLLQGVTQLGLGGIAIFLWYMDRQRITGLEDIVKEQIEEKRQLREDRVELLRIVRECAQTLQRASAALEASERRNRDAFGKGRGRV